MSKIRSSDLRDFVEENIQHFHAKRLASLSDTKLKDLLERKNPYLFKAKNLITAQDLIVSFLDAKLSSSEEKMFGDFLESLAIFVAKKSFGATKSTGAGLDFEFEREGTHYVVTVKSGANWGNSSQWKSLGADYRNAIKVLKQSRHVKDVQCILGVAYGKGRTTIRLGIIKIVYGQTFWYLLSGDKNFYVKIIEPIGHRAKEHNEAFLEKKAELINKFTKEFLEDFCTADGKIDWQKLVQFNSGNLTKANAEASL